MHSLSHTPHCSFGLPIAAKKSLPKKGNPGLLARKIILKSGWMGMDVGRLLKGESPTAGTKEEYTVTSWRSNN